MSWGWNKKGSQSEFCKCGHQIWGHKPKIRSCYVCDCKEFTPGTNPIHRYQVARPVKTSYKGIMFQSKAEALYAGELDLRKKSNDILDWSYHPLIRIFFNDVHICDYEIDFLVELKDDWKEYVEVKGEIANTPVWRLKWKMAKAYFKNEPKVKLTLIWV